MIMLHKLLVSRGIIRMSSWGGYLDKYSRQEQKAEAAVGTCSPKLDTDVGARIWHQIKSKWIHGPNLPCVNSPGSWQRCRKCFLGTILINPINHGLKATACLSIVADHEHPFMTTICPSSNGYFQHTNAASQSRRGFMNMTMSSVFFSDLPSHQSRIQKNTFGMC